MIAEGTGVERGAGRLLRGPKGRLRSRLVTVAPVSRAEH